MKLLLKKFSKLSGITSLVVHIKSGNPNAGPMPRYPDSLQRSSAFGSSGGAPSSHTVLGVALSGLSNFDKKIAEVLRGRSVVDGHINRYEPITGGTFWNHSSRIGLSQKREVIGRELNNTVGLVGFRKQVTRRETNMRAHPDTRKFCKKTELPVEVAVRHYSFPSRKTKTIRQLPLFITEFERTKLKNHMLVRRS